MSNPKYGWRIIAAQEGPLKSDRRTTDFLFAGIFRAFLLIWLMVAIYASFVHDNEDSIITILEKSLTLFASGRGYEPEQSLRRVIYYGFKYIALVAKMSILFIIILSQAASFMVFTSILLVCIGLIVGCFLTTGSMATHPDSALYSFLSLVVLLAMLGGFVFCIIMSRKKIITACGIIEEISRDVNSFPSLLLLPIIQFSIYIGVIVFAAYVFASIITIRLSEEFSFVRYILHLINVFGLVWFSGFVIGLGKMILAGTYATWFCTLDKRFVPRDTVFNVVENILRYHTGTLALGYLVHGVGWNIQTTNGQKCLGLKCCSNRYAHIMTVLHSTDLRKSENDVANLLERSDGKIAISTKVTDGILILGRIVLISVAFIATRFDYEFQKGGLNAERLYMYILFVAGSVLVTDCLFSFIKMSVDTIFLCFLEDYERNDGSEEKPYHASSKLQSLLLK